MGTWAQRDHRPGDDWSLGQLYALVPDAYELDLLEDARRTRDALFEIDQDRQWARLVDDILNNVDVENIAISDGPALPAAQSAESLDPSAPSITQAQFMVERLLGGEVVDERRS